MRLEIRNIEVDDLKCEGLFRIASRRTPHVILAAIICVQGPHQRPPNNTVSDEMVQARTEFAFWFIKHRGVRNGTRAMVFNMTRVEGPDGASAVGTGESGTRWLIEREDLFDDLSFSDAVDVFLDTVQSVFEAHLRQLYPWPKDGLSVADEPR